MNNQRPTNLFIDDEPETLTEAKAMLATARAQCGEVAQGEPRTLAGAKAMLKTARAQCAAAAQKKLAANPVTPPPVEKAKPHTASADKAKDAFACAAAEPDPRKRGALFAACSSRLAKPGAASNAETKSAFQAAAAEPDPYKRGCLFADARRKMVPSH